MDSRGKRMSDVMAMFELQRQLLRDFDGAKDLP